MMNYKSREENLIKEGCVTVYFYYNGRYYTSSSDIERFGKERYSRENPYHGLSEFQRTQSLKEAG